MLDMVRENIKRAWTKFLGWSGLISERVRVEIAVIGIIQEIKRIDERIEEIYKTVGKRFFELKQMQEKNILKDEEITNCLIEIQRLLKEKESLIKRASEITEIGGHRSDV